MYDTNVSTTSAIAPPPPAPWLVLIPQLPAKPDYLRVKLQRRMKRIGALPLRSSVYVLPNRTETVEDFEWLRREIVADGGDAMMFEAACVAGVSDSTLESLFRAASDEEFAALAVEARQPESARRAASTGDARMAPLRRRLSMAAKTDWFGSSQRTAAEAAMEALERRDYVASSAASSEEELARLVGRIWVTRADVFVDRIASAWLIRRFIDPHATFRFVAGSDYRPEAGALRFDMYQGEYTHVGDRCTFETLLQAFELSDPALVAISEIVHDIDCKDEKFDRPEATGVEAVLAGLVRGEADDLRRLEAGGALFDGLYLQFGGTATT